MSMTDADPTRPWHRFPARLLAARLAAGMKQSELAAACKKGGNNQWVAQLESGKNKRQLDDVHIISAVLNVPPEWLLFGRIFGVPGAAVALGRGGANVALSPQHRIADLVLYPGAYTSRGFARSESAHLFVSLDKLQPDTRTRLYLQNVRGSLIVIRGRLRDDGCVYGVNGEELASKSVIGLCWRIRRPTNLVHPAK